MLRPRHFCTATTKCDFEISLLQVLALWHGNHLRTMNVQALCDRLVANDASLTELYIYLVYADDAKLKLIVDAAKKNKTVKKVFIRGSSIESTLSVPALLSLASLVSEHPDIQEIGFCMVEVIEFGPIALAIQQNRKLTRLLL
jgi:hypothetical protein